MFSKLLFYFSKPKRLAWFNFITLLVGILVNAMMQIYCIPTNWAGIVLIFSFTAVILYPIAFYHKKVLSLFSFVNGISFIIFVYCIIFLEHINLLGILLPLIYLPHILAIQLIWNHLIKPKTKNIRLFFIIGIAVSISVFGLFGYQYKEAINHIEQLKMSNYSTLEKTFMTEKILGMHFIYHTRFCEYDGWRPPIHDPGLVIGLWLNQRTDPLENISLENRIQLYKKFYPNKKIKQDCSCAWQYSKNYHTDKLWINK